jgi:hypothetical protein
MSQCLVLRGVKKGIASFEISYSSLAVCGNLSTGK